MITTHILDTSLGRPAAGVAVTLERQEAGQWRAIGKGLTDADGRLRALTPDGPVDAGTYRLTFETGNYFEKLGIPSFYPSILIAFEIKDAAQDAHYHVPLLVSPYGYTTYRGS